MTLFQLARLPQNVAGRQCVVESDISWIFGFFLRYGYYNVYILAALGMLKLAFKVLNRCRKNKKLCVCKFQNTDCRSPKFSPTHSGAAVLCVVGKTSKTTVLQTTTRSVASSQKNSKWDNIRKKLIC